MKLHLSTAAPITCDIHNAPPLGHQFYKGHPVKGLSHPCITVTDEQAADLVRASICDFTLVYLPDFQKALAMARYQFIGNEGYNFRKATDHLVRSDGGVEV